MQRKVENLYQEIHRLEGIHKGTRGVEVGAKLIACREELKNLLLEKAKAKIARYRGLFYAKGDKPGRLLANALKSQYTQAFIPKVVAKDGSIVNTTTEILESFKNVFEELYNLKEGPVERQEICNHYIRNSGMPRLDEEEVEELEELITLDELRIALKNTKSGKAPGPDGYTVNFNKTYIDTIGPHLVEAFNVMAEETPKIRDPFRAIISLKAKEGKDHTQCDSFRPIALLNADLKLFSKIIADRLIKKIPKLIHLDQVGFVPGREGRDNSTRVLDVMQIALERKEELMLLSTDANKAFDRVSWPYMKATIEHIGLGEK